MGKEARSKIYPHIYRRSFKATTTGRKNPSLYEVMGALALAPEEAEDAVSEEGFLDYSRLEHFFSLPDPHGTTAALETIQQWLLRQKDRPQSFASLANYNHRLSVWCALVASELIMNRFELPDVLERAEQTKRLLRLWVLRADHGGTARQLAEDKEFFGIQYGPRGRTMSPVAGFNCTQQASGVFQNMIDLAISPSGVRSPSARSFFYSTSSTRFCDKTVVYGGFHVERAKSEVVVMDAIAEAVLSFPYRGE